MADRTPPINGKCTLSPIIIRGNTIGGQVHLWDGHPQGLWPEHAATASRGRLESGRCRRIIGVGRAHASAMERGRQNITLLILWRSQRRSGAGRGAARRGRRARVRAIPCEQGAAQAAQKEKLNGEAPPRLTGRGLHALLEDGFLIAGPVGAVTVAFQVLDQDGVDGCRQAREVKG